jgi:signal transduction histidine kinase
VVRPDGLPLDWDVLPVARAQRGEPASPERLLVLLPDGTTVPMLASAASFFQGDRLAGVVATWHDLTEGERLTVLEERHHLARELHDSLSQALYGVGLGVQTALTLFDRDRARAIEALNFVLSLVQAGNTEMRALIFDLRPESLANEGLVAALRKQIAAIQARFGLDTAADLGAEPDLPLEIKEAAYQVAREAMHNAVRHARANRLEVRLSCGAAGLMLAVADDGVGFIPEAPCPGHLGLRSMGERCSRLGGTFCIDSQPGHGTRVSAVFPTAWRLVPPKVASEIPGD